MIIIPQKVLRTTLDLYTPYAFDFKTRRNTGTEVSGVYSIHNQENNRIYIGSSYKIISRWRLHRSMLRNGKHHNNLLLSDYLLYGGEAFVFYYVIPSGRLEEEKAVVDQIRCENASRLYNIGSY